MSDDPRISVSREALRAELAEMELRLRIYFDAQLHHKADTVDVANLRRAVDALDRGDFTPVHRRALTEFIEEVTREKSDRGWTNRQRVLGLVALGVAVLSFALSIYIGVGISHG